MKKLTANKTLIILLTIFTIISFPEASFAGRRVVKTKVVTIRKLPGGHRIIKHGRKRYYCHNGIFYKKTSKGFTIVKAPIGLKIKKLPVGFITIRIGGRKYYRFDSTYYRYDPVKKVYFVIKKPI